MVASLTGIDYPYNWITQERLRKATISGIKSDTGAWMYRCLKQSVNAWTYVPSTKEWAWDRPALFFMSRIVMVAFYTLCCLGVRASRENLLVNTILGGHLLYCAIVLFPLTVEARYLISVYATLIPLSVIGLMSIRSQLLTSIR